MRDGSRHFYDFPEILSFESCREFLKTLGGAEITGYLTDQVTEVWIDLNFRGHKFSVNNQCGEYWCFVENPACSDEILGEFVAHCEKLG